MWLGMLWDSFLGTFVAFGILAFILIFGAGLDLLEDKFPSDIWYTYTKLGLNIAGSLSAILVYVLAIAKGIWQFIREWKREAAEDEPQN